MKAHLRITLKNNYTLILAMKTHWLKYGSWIIIFKPRSVVLCPFPIYTSSINTSPALLTMILCSLNSCPLLTWLVSAVSMLMQVYFHLSITKITTAWIQHGIYIVKGNICRRVGPSAHLVSATARFMEVTGLSSSPANTFPFLLHLENIHYISVHCYSHNENFKFFLSPRIST